MQISIMSAYMRFVLKLAILLQWNCVMPQKSPHGTDLFYNIGGVLSSNESEIHFSTTIAVSAFSLFYFIAFKLFFFAFFLLLYFHLYYIWAFTHQMKLNSGVCYAIRKFIDTAMILYWVPGILSASVFLFFIFNSCRGR